MNKVDGDDAQIITITTRINEYWALKFIFWIRVLHSLRSCWCEFASLSPQKNSSRATLKKLSSERFFISILIFKEHCTIFLVKISWQCCQLSSESVYFFSYLFWDAKTRTVFASIIIISLLQSIIQDQARDQAAKVTSRGMSACDCLDCLKEKQQGKYIMVCVSWSVDGWMNWWVDEFQ